MPIGPKITDDVRSIISEVYLNHKDWVAKEVMAEVHTRLRKNNSNVKPNWPGISAIQIELRKIRRKYEQIRELGQEQPWSLVTLDKYPIPPEALPSVIQSWVYARESKNRPFTVRDAKWVARIYAVYRDIEKLVKYALDRARSELIGETLGGSRRTEDYDEADIAVLYEILTGEMLSDERYERILAEKPPPMNGETIKQIGKEFKKRYQEAHDERSHSQEVQE